MLCKRCNHFFHEEDWEFAVMQKGACPFCAAHVESNYGNGSVSTTDAAQPAEANGKLRWGAVAQVTKPQAPAADVASRWGSVVRGARA